VLDSPDSDEIDSRGKSQEAEPLNDEGSWKLRAREGCRVTADGADPNYLNNHSPAKPGTVRSRATNTRARPTRTARSSAGKRVESWSTARTIVPKGSVSPLTYASAPRSTRWVPTNLPREGRRRVRRQCSFRVTPHPESTHARSRRAALRRSDGQLPSRGRGMGLRVAAPRGRMQQFWDSQRCR